MEIGLLGPLEVTEGGQAITVAGGKRRGLLARLAIDAGNVVTTDVLIEELWGDEQLGNVANALQVQVSQLRKLLPEGSVVARPRGYVLAVDPGVIDATRFERLVEQGRDARAGGDAAAASATLQQALGLWRGPALVDVLDLPGARAVANRLDELRASALEERIDADLELGRHEELVAELQAAVAEHPLREHLRVQLMLALYRSGRQADALAAYQDARRHLAEELGLDPGPELQQLEGAILRQDLELQSTADTAAPSRLPIALTTFVGRDDDLRELAGLLDVHRLVTITGPGGAGKTRLALELAGRLHLDDGVWLVDLAPVADLDDVAPAVARTLGLAPERLVAYLTPKQPLLVLDNCEHVLASIAPLAASLLAAAPGLRLLATSREPLNLGGEMQWPLPPLALEDAVHLFADRATALDPAFQGDEAAVTEICGRLDGLPLAIELAAARTKALPVGDIAARLDDRFRLLTTGERTALPRHQTLRALVDWSYDLLFDEQRALFDHLSLFPGGFALDAAETMAEHAGLDPADALDLLASLVDKSLVVSDPRSRTARYRILETLRQYGHDRLAADRRLEAARRRQAEWCLTLAEQASAQLYGPATADALDRLVDVELDNVRAAMAWAIDAGDAQLAARLGIAYARPMWERGHQREGKTWLVDALALPGAARLPVDMRVLAHIWLASVCSDHDRALARDAAEHAVAIAREGAPADVLAASQVILAQALVDDGELDGARKLLAIARDRLTGWQLGWCEEVSCYAALRAGDDLDGAEAAAHRSLEIYDALGNPWSQGRLRHKLALIAELRGDLRTAIHEYDASIELARPLAVHEIIAVRVGQLGRAHEMAGDTGRAAELRAESDALVDWLGGVDTTGPIARRRSDLALARGELNDLLAWYEAAGHAGGVTYVRERLESLTAAVA